MLSIKFYAESDLKDYSEAVKEYQSIWDTYGKRIVKTYEKNSGLSFNETQITANIADLMSVSHPLTLRYNLAKDNKLIVLTHELGHRLLYKRVQGMGKSRLERHKFLYLILYDVLTDLVDENLAKEAVEWDKRLPDEKYTNSWDYALSFNRDERKTKFLEILKNKI